MTRARASRAALVLLLTVVFVDIAGFGIVIPFLPFWAEHFGASPAEVALLMSAYSLTQFIFAPVLGRLSDRYGRKPVLLVSVFGSVLSFLWMAFAGSLWMLFAARAVAGAMGANIAVANAGIADITPGEERARGMGLVGMAFGLGFVLGPAIGALLAGPDIATTGFRLPFLAGAGVSALAFAGGLVLLREPDRHRPGTVLPGGPLIRLRAFLALLASPGLGLPLLLLALLSLAMSGIESTFALWAERQLLWGPRQTGLFLVWIGVCMAAVQGGLVGPVVARLGEVRTARLGTGVCAAGMALAPLALNIPVVLLSGFLIAAGLGLGQPALNALLSRASAADIQGGVMGGAQSAQSLARIAGPALAGLLFTAFDRQGPWISGAILLLLGVALATRLRDPGDQPGAATGS